MKTFLVLAALLGCALMAGLFFFAFSVAVMKALGQLPPARGIEAMQTINTVIQNPLFFAVFMGTAALCVWAPVAALREWNDPASRWLLSAGICYLVGVFLVTAVVNVPMNDALAAVKPDSKEAIERVWPDYLAFWTLWNHVRTVASLGATGLFALAFRAL